MENKETVQSKPEENNSKVPEPNTEKSAVPQEDKNKDNIPTINEAPKLKESQILPEEEEKKEEVKQDNPQIVPQQEINNNIPTENLPVKEPPKINQKQRKNKKI